MDSSQPNPGQIFGSNTPPHTSASRLPSPLCLHQILSCPTDCPGNLLQFDFPSVNPWASPPVVGDFDARTLRDTQAPGLPPSLEKFVPGTLEGSWGGSFSMNTPDTQDTEPPTLLPPPGEFDWGAALSNYSPVLPSIPGLEGCISTREQYFTVQSSCSKDLAF